MKTTANGIEMHYELSGTGECLVLIHGFTDNMNMWSNQIPEFERHCQVLRYDVRGFGRTEKAGGYSLRLFADDLHQLLGVLRIESACVLGYSMGGRIALEFALSHPEMTSGVIFANSGIGAPLSAEMEERREMLLGIMEQGDNDTISELMTVASFSPDFKERNPAAFRAYKDVKLQNDPSPYPAIMRVLLESFEAPAHLDRLQCPVLIIAGDSDTFMEVSVGESMQRSIKDSVLRVLPTGHAAAIETPAEFNRLVLDFLEGLGRVPKGS